MRGLPRRSAPGMQGAVAGIDRMAGKGRASYCVAVRAAECAGKYATMHRNVRSAARFWDSGGLVSGFREAPKGALCPRRLESAVFSTDFNDGIMMSYLRESEVLDEVVLIRVSVSSECDFGSPFRIAYSLRR